ncbi:RodZ domain-containing protein [Cellvibrio mixtus]|uniref:RodZ domain-containing protein n=1 Tax=Cellvibrio mixtus TaxID=39650 RepID=UPI000587B166|nr:RodZ domain-containing protein [Cellvibrio mixtus]
MFSDDEKKAADDSRFGELSPGKLLVWARERAGLTQEQVAKELYMTLTKVRALEADDYRHMGSDTFTRGYLRSYANLVKLDVVQLLAAYDRHAQKHGLIEQVMPRKVESTSKPLWQFVVLIVIVLLVLWLISVWFFDNRKAPEYAMPAAIVTPIETFVSSSASGENSSATNSDVSNAINSINSVSAINNFPSNSSTGIASTSTPSVALNSSVASSLITNASASSFNAKQEVRNATLDQIVFIFSEECWLEVSDSRGDVLVADLQPAGGRITLQGKAPFDVTLGNSPAAQIELNSKKVTVVPALGTNVLRLKVGKSISD